MAAFSETAADDVRLDVLIVALMDLNCIITAFRS